ncbi:SHOCT domain-containing protein [Zhengella sp. ZM62]|uniref:SHOCT domain-containing protein n=1 Tax=Zhengella sedimenti TaxID=3390035 RepID=UPI003975445C
MRQMAILAIIGLTTPTLAVADPGENWQGGYGHMMWGGGYGMFGGLMMILFWGIVIALIVFAVKWFTDNQSGGNRGKRDAIEILRERFASGEIDEEEFDRRRKALEK